MNAKALNIPSQVDEAMEGGSVHQLKRRRQDSSPPFVARQRANPAMTSNPLFSSSPLAPHPRVGVPIDRLNLDIPDSLNAARAASTDWVRGWQMLLGTGMTVEASTVAVTVSDQFPTVEVTKELENFRETVRERRRTLMEEVPDEDQSKSRRPYHLFVCSFAAL